MEPDSVTDTELPASSLSDTCMMWWTVEKMSLTLKQRSLSLFVRVNCVWSGFSYRRLAHVRQCLVYLLLCCRSKDDGRHPARPSTINLLCRKMQKQADKTSGRKQDIDWTLWLQMMLMSNRQLQTANSSTVNCCSPAQTYMRTMHV